MTFLKEKWQYGALIAIAGVMFWFLYQNISSATHSSEIKNLTSGYSYIRYLDYRLEPSLPPLPKIISALPLLFSHKTFPVDSPEWDQSDTEAIGKNFITAENIKWARYINILASVILLLLVYTIGRACIGKSWALLPTFLMLGETYFRKYAAISDGKIIAAVFTLASIHYFISSPNYRSKKRAVYSGIFLGLALASAFENLILVPSFIAITLIVFIALTFKEWGNIDPSMRTNHLKIRVHYLMKSIFITVLAAFLTLYAILALGSFGHPPQKQIAETESLSKSIFINWLSGNATLRPLGSYALGKNLYFSQRETTGTGKISNESTLLLIFIVTSGILSLWRSIKSFVQSIKYGTTPLIDYLSANSYDFSMLFTTAILTTLALKSYEGKELVMLILMPQLICLSSISIKKWFAEENDGLRRNYILNLKVFAKNILGLSIKTLIFIVFILLYFVLIFNS